MTLSPQSPIPQDNQLECEGGIPSSTSSTVLPTDWQYEATVEVVESIIAQIESGDLELADIFEQFGVAVQHLQDCEVFLNHHRQQVDILVETLMDES